MVRPDFILYAVVAFIVVGILCKIPGSIYKGRILFLRDFFFIYFLIFSALSLIFANDIKRGVFPYTENYFITPDNTKIIPYFQQTEITVQKPKKPLKNLIQIHIECSEKGSIGLFNRQFPTSMPFLRSLVERGTFLTNVTMQNDQGFTISSIFTQQSSLPMLGNSYKDRGSLLLSKRVHTVSDFLHKLGYEQIASSTGFFSRYKFFNLHNVKVIDVLTHKQDHDYGHYEYVLNTLLPELSKKKDNPFMLLVFNEDSHPNFYIEKKCFDTLPASVKKWPRALVSLQCVDRLLERFFKKFHELGLQDNTEVFIYGDHLLFGDHYFYEEPRKMFMLFPFKEKKFIDKPISLFDVPSSILSLLGIDEYSPKFPFGFDFFSPNVSKIPTNNDRKYISNFANSIDS